MHAARVRRDWLRAPSNRRLRRPGREGSALDSVRAACRSIVRPMLFLAAAAVLAAGAVTGSRWLLHSPHFMVKHIRIDGTRRAGADELRRRIGLDPGSNIFRIGVRDVVRDLESHPWVKHAAAHRELPDTVAVEITEYEPSAVVLMGHLYLADADGRLFKRVVEGEARDLVVVSGIDRVAYLEDRPSAESRIREALDLIEAYRRPGRPRLSEVSLDAGGGFTLYTYHGAMQVRLGRSTVGRALTRLDVVLAALGPDLVRARTIHLDGSSQRVAVRLAAEAEPTATETQR
jgi:cell division septal protein FtsQ